MPELTREKLRETLLSLRSQVVSARKRGDTKAEADAMRGYLALLDPFFKKGGSWGDLA